MYKHEYNLTRGSAVKVEVICDNCGKEYITQYNYTVKNFERFGKHLCKLCAIRTTNSSEKYKENMSKAIRKMHEEHPEIREKMSITLKERKVNVGDKNGMKSAEARKKASETRKKKFQEDPEFAKMHADMTKQAWADGKYANVKVGRCKWYDYTRKDGSLVKCQGTWEWAFVKWADENNVKFKTHKGRIPYIDNDGKQKNYYPDFYVEDWECFIDIKSKYFLDLNKEKIECIIKSNPNLKLKILSKEELVKLGVNLQEKPEEYYRK